MKIISLLIILLNLTACNVYELVDQGNKISDEFEDLIKQPRIELLTQSVSLTDLNATPGINIYFNILNGSFNQKLRQESMILIAFGTLENG